MSVEKYKAYLEVLGETIKQDTGSEAAHAVMAMASEMLTQILVKNTKRGDSWVNSFDAYTCVGLVKAKCDRVQIMLNKVSTGQLKMEDYRDEIVEENADAANYLAFATYLVRRNGT